MRSFRKDSENLRDVRIAYTFLLSLALVCAILGVVATRLGGDLKQSRLDGYYESLSLCADALEAWERAQGVEARYEASVRFENAAAGLPSEVDLEAVAALGDHMRMGDSATVRVRAFADAFALLSSIDYVDEAEARRIVAETLDGVGEALGLDASVPAVGIELPPAEVLAYSKGVAERTVKWLFGRNSVGLELVQDESGAWSTETQNLRMTFSASDGSLEGFVYIRLGDASGDKLDGGQRLSAALEFFKSTRRGARGALANMLSETCGFMLCEVVDGEEKWHITVDAYGRVWSLTKVKR